MTSDSANTAHTPEIGTASLRGGDQRADLLGAVAHVARRLLQERARARRALVVQPERLHLRALAQPDRLHGLAADVQDGARAGEEVRRAPRAAAVRSVTCTSANVDLVRPKPVATM
jgi:hypothetical protein